MRLIVLILALASAAFAAAPKPVDTSKPPEKLSELYRFFTLGIRTGLGAEVVAAPVRIQGRSWELVKEARFPEVELVLKPFEAQSLKFEKAEFLFRRLELDKGALDQWELKLKAVKEVQSRLVFTLRSLAKKLSDAKGKEIRLQAEMEEQALRINGPGSFLFIPCQVESRCRVEWDEPSRTLRLKPIEQRFASFKIPRWFWWLGSSPVPSAPVLDFGSSWIPFNIQEVHLGWDSVNLSTNW